MTTGARPDWPQHLGYKTCVPKFRNSGSDVEELKGSRRHDLAFIKFVQGAFVTKKMKVNVPVAPVVKRSRTSLSAENLIV